MLRIHGPRRALVRLRQALLDLVVPVPVEEGEDEVDLTDDVEHRQPMSTDAYTATSARTCPMAPIILSCDIGLSVSLKSDSYVYVYGEWRGQGRETRRTRGER